ncbi:BRO-N domain-containing protein [Rhodopirellula baltica]
MQYVTFVNEAGIYALIFGSKLPAARKLKHWVFNEVLRVTRDRLRPATIGLASSSQAIAIPPLRPTRSQCLRVGQAGWLLGLRWHMPIQSQVSLFAKPSCTGYSAPRNAVSRFCKAEDVMKRYTLTYGGSQEATFVNESGLYSLVFGSQLHAAKRLKRWVTSEVLPSIRKTGSYGQRRIDLDNPKFLDELDLHQRAPMSLPDVEDLAGGGAALGILIVLSLWLAGKAISLFKWIFRRD